MDNKKLKKLFKNNKFKILFPVLLIVLLIVIKFNFTKDARKLGRALGRNYGTIVGNTKGSYEGNRQGIEDGIKDARIPETPTIEIAEKIQSQSKLHILDANIEITQPSKYGDQANPDLAALFSKNATADYYIDLSTVSVQENNIGLVIIVNDVEFECIYSTEKPALIEKYVKKDIESAKAKKMYEDSEKKITEEIYKKFNEDTNSLKIQAREIAQRQVSDLARLLSGKSITVKFKSKDGIIYE
mgnify:FL=1